MRTSLPVRAALLGFCCVLLLAPPALLAADAPVSQVLGNWLSEPGDAVIQITAGAGGALDGRIIGNIHAARRDDKNPDAALRPRLLRGALIMQGLMPDGDGHWSGGTIYDPDSGHTYSARLQVLDGEHLRVRGFLGFSLFGRTQVWTRYHGTSLDLPEPAH